MKAFIVNDTTKIISNGKHIQHFGCELVMQTFHEQLKRVDIELVGSVGRDKTFQVPKGTDLVIVNGEGSVHNGNRGYMLKIAQRYPSVFVNAVWENNPPHKALQKFKYVSVRESFSYQQLPKHHNSEIVPDIIFASKTLRTFRKPVPTKNIGKTDNVTNKQAGITAHMPVKQYLNEISQYKSLCVGRFHALIVAAVLEIPFSVWKPNTHKNIGILTDMEVPHLYYKTQAEALQNVPKQFDERIRAYADQAQGRVERMFEKLHEL